MGVAIGGRIDDDLKPFASAVGAQRVVSLARRTINRADIGGRVGWRTTSGDVGKFARVIGREKDVVMGKIKAIGRGMRIPHQRRERSFGAGYAGHGVARPSAKAQVSKRRRIAIVNDDVSRNRFTARQPYARRAPALHQHFGNIGVGADRRALPCRKPRDGCRQRVNSSLDQPDAARLDMGDQHQRGRRLKRR